MTTRIRWIMSLFSGVYMHTILDQATGRLDGGISGLVRILPFKIAELETGNANIDAGSNDPLGFHEQGKSYPCDTLQIALVYFPACPVGVWIVIHGLLECARSALDDEAGKSCRCRRGPLHALLADLVLSLVAMLNSEAISSSTLTYALGGGWNAGHWLFAACVGSTASIVAPEVLAHTTRRGQSAEGGAVGEGRRGTGFAFGLDPGNLDTAFSAIL